MKRLIRICLGLVSLVLLAIAAVAVAALLIFDPNDYRGVIADLVKTETGRRLEIEGDLTLDVLPCCGVNVEGVRLSNHPDFAGNAFVSVDAVEIDLRLLPLILRQEIVIGDVRLAGLELSLVRRADGEANWTFDPQTADAPAEVDPVPDDEISELPLPTIAGLIIDDAQIEYRDEIENVHYRLENFDFTADGVRMRQLMNIDTSFHLTDVLTATTLQGGVQSQAILDPDAMRVTLVNLHADIDADGRDLPPGGIALSLQANEIDYDANAASGSVNTLVADVKLAGAGLQLSGNGSFTDSGADLSGVLELAPFSPSAVMRALGEAPIETADPAVLTKFQGTARWSVKQNLLRVDRIDVRLDDTDIGGRVQINYPDQSDLQFDLSIGTIDLDRYLAPEQESAGSLATESVDAEELPVDALKELDMDGHLRVERIKLNGMQLQNLDVTIAAANGLIRIDPATADLYGGRYAGVIKLDVTGQKPSASVDQSISAVRAGGLITDFADVNNFEGLLEARINATGVGRSSDEIVENLAGKVSFDLADGVYNGVDLWHEIRKARALLKGEPQPQAIEDPKTQITALAFSGRMADGQLTSERMIAEIPFLRLNGNGVLNLVEQNMNYHFNAKVYDKPVFADGEDLSGLENLTIPLTLTGDLAAPSVGVDFTELAKNEVVRKGRDLLLEKLGLDEPAPATEDTATEDSATDQNKAQEQPERSPKDDARELLKKGLRDLF